MSQPIVWGMIHVPALPGSRNNSKTIDEIVEFCLEDAKIYLKGGINHLFIENFGDIPFPKTASKPHVIAGLTAIITLIKNLSPNLIIGVNVLRNDALSALGIAEITRSYVIRVNVLSHARLTDQGIIEGCAFELSDYAHQLKSKVQVWADIDVKHSFPLSEIPVEQAIQDMIERGGADKIIFTGSRTGSQADKRLLKKLVEDNILKPEQIVIGSGITSENIRDFIPYASNFIVGSSLKINNDLSNNVDAAKVLDLISKIK